MRSFRHLQELNVHAAICMDADTQHHDPHDIPKFIQAMKEYPNHIIIGARTYNTENAPKARRRANLIADFLFPGLPDIVLLILNQVIVFILVIFSINLYVGYVLNDLLLKAKC